MAARRWVLAAARNFGGLMLTSPVMSAIFFIRLAKLGTCFAGMFRAVVDHPMQVEWLLRQCSRADRPPPVRLLVDVDVGQARTGQSVGDGVAACPNDRGTAEIKASKEFGLCRNCVKHIAESAERSRGPKSREQIIGLRKALSRKG